MDILTLAGLVVGFGAILFGLVLEGGHLASILQPTAFFIVVGGTLGAVMVQTPGATFRTGLGMVGWIFSPPKHDYEGLAERFQSWAKVARATGPLALEEDALRAQDPVLRKALTLVVDGVDMDKGMDALVGEINARASRLKQAAKIWESAGGYAPTIGILGAVLGLIHVMENLEDPSSLGSGIAVAFVATVYGVGFANLVFLPVGNKLKALIGHQLTYWQMVAEGAYGVGKGENPTMLKERLLALVQH